MLALTLSLAAGCFSHHIDVSLAQSEAAMPVYDDESHGASLPLSLQLLAAEQAMRPLAAALDAAAEVNRVGERWCALFDPPATTAAPARAATTTATTASARPFDASLAAMLLAHVNDADYARVDALTTDAIEALADPAHDCMARHILEAMRRTARAAAGDDDERAREVFVTMMRLQSSSLPGAIALDERARAVQDGGVPIICADVPSMR